MVFLSGAVYLSNSLNCVFVTCPTQFEITITPMHYILIVTYTGPVLYEDVCAVMWRAVLRPV